MNIKKLLLITLLILIAGLMIGCGGGDSDGGSDNEETARVEVAPRGASAGDVAEGKKQYEQLCSACHGMDAKGMPNLGKDLTTSEFLKTKSDDEFVEFIKVGRPSGDPLNTTGVDMPPKGGNPALTDQNMYDIVAYVRTLEE